MSRAAELFYSRRSRIGRNSDPSEVSIIESPTSSDRTANRRRRIPGSGSHTRHQEGCDLVRGAYLGQRLPTTLHRSDPSQGRGPISLEGGGHHFPPTDEGLPRSVVLARERLLQRLSGVSLSSPRRNNGSTLNSNLRNEILHGEDFRLVDSVDWDTRDFPASLALITRASKRSPGLTQEAIKHLPKSIFVSVSEEQDTSKTLNECSICLEVFSNGDELIHLHCGHRYHVSCLVPWVSTCGDCPYCRQKIYERNPRI